MARQKLKKRLQTAQVNVRLTPDQLERLELAVEKLQTGAQMGARYSLSGLLVTAGLAEADKVLGAKASAPKVPKVDPGGDHVDPSTVSTEDLRTWIRDIETGRTRLRGRNKIVTLAKLKELHEELKRREK
jgi:hypothetical protein